MAVILLIQKVGLRFLLLSFTLFFSRHDFTQYTRSGILLEHVVGIGRKDNRIAEILGQNGARAGGGTLTPARRF